FSYVPKGRAGQLCSHDRNRHPWPRENLQRGFLAQETEVCLTTVAPASGGRRNLRLSRPQWGREDDHTQAAHGSGLSHGWIGANSGHGNQRSAHEGADWFSSRATVFL